MNQDLMRKEGKQRKASQSTTSQDLLKKTCNNHHSQDQVRKINHSPHSQVKRLRYTIHRKEQLSGKRIHAWKAAS